MENIKFCSWCLRTDHQRKSSKLCPFYSNNQVKTKHRTTLECMNKYAELLIHLNSQYCCKIGSK